MDKLVFFFPDKEVGGVGMLFVRLVKHLNFSKRANAFLIDYADGWSRKYLEPREIIVYNKVGTILPNDSIVIFQHSTVYRLEQNLVGKNIKCLFWCLHVNNSLLQIPLLTNIIRRRPNSFLFRLFVRLPMVAESYIHWSNFLLKRSALVFMEKNQIEFMGKFDDEGFNEAQVLPIFYPLTEKKLLPESKGENILWLGRLVDFKLPALLHLLDELESVRHSRIVYIVGDGDQRSFLENHSRKLQTKVVFLGTKTPEEIKHLVQSQTIGYGLAMGTSILELLNLGLRVVGCNVSYSKSRFAGYLSSNDFLQTLGSYGDRINHTSFLKLINEDYTMHDDLVKYFGNFSLEQLIFSACNSELDYNEIKSYPRGLAQIYKILNYLRHNV